MKLKQWVTRRTFPIRTGRYCSSCWLVFQLQAGNTLPRRQNLNLRIVTR